MVNITPEEVMAQRKAAKEGPEFSEFDRKIIGGGVRIDIPMDSRINLAKFGDVLEDLAANLRTLSKSQHMTPRQAMIEASFQCYAARKLIQEIAGLDQPSSSQQMRAKMARKLLG
jgi:hypothetical protein